MKYTLQIILTFLIFSSTLSFAQNIEANRLRLADSYLNGGDTENALRVYMQIFDSNPSSERAYEGLKTILYQENRFDELLSKSLAYEKYSKNFEIYSLIGELYYAKGKIDSSRHYWNVGLSKFPKSKETYSSLSLIQNKVGLYNEAVKTLLDGRKRLSDQNLFADELSKMYIASNDYKNGIVEIIKLLYVTMRPEQAQGRIYALMENKESKEYISQYLKNLYEENQNDLHVLQIYSWFLREIGKSDEALKLVEKIDDLSNANGREIYTFAVTAMNDEEYDLALKSYQILIDEGNSKENRYFSSALFNYAKTLDSRLENSTKEITKEKYLEIIKEYQNIIDKYNNSSVAANAMLRIAEIYSEKIGDDAKAKSSIQALASDRRFMRSSQAAEALLLLADINIKNDELDSAKTVLENLKRSFNKGSGDFALRAQFLLAEIEFYEGNAEIAYSLYKQVGKSLDANIANDALQRNLLISQNKEQTEALKQYAMGLKAQKQNKLQDAILRFDKAYMLASGTSLANDAILRTLDIIQKTQPEKYLEKVENYIASNSESLILDKVLLYKADFLVQQKKYEDAEKIYIKILTEFPQSIYLEEVREKIKNIRNRKV